MTIKLKEQFTPDGIVFRWIKHPLPEYDYFDKMMNAQYGQIAIKKEELVTSKIFTNITLLTIHDDMVDLL